MTSSQCKWVASTRHSNYLRKSKSSSYFRERESEIGDLRFSKWSSLSFLHLEFFGRNFETLRVRVPSTISELGRKKRKNRIYHENKKTKIDTILSSCWEVFSTTFVFYLLWEVCCSSFPQYTKLEDAIDFSFLRHLLSKLISSSAGKIPGMKTQ